MVDKKGNKKQGSGAITGSNFIAQRATLHVPWVSEHELFKVY